MGKNSLIKSLGRCIGNVVLHKILFSYTNKLESVNHLKGEIVEYSADVLEKFQEFKWSEEEISLIEKMAVRRVENLSKNYPDVKYKNEEVLKLVKETIEELR